MKPNRLLRKLPTKVSAEAAVNGAGRQTRRFFSAGYKFGIVLEGLRSVDRVAGF
ncbi:hypothetical protein QUC32_29960 (plasmid) [Novosphingobium resinovorum]|jgi:hypothetical protein|uniref:hypothetical protein n=1 Tax=Sphingomonadaceae TaxID=41297 RepID=UPI0012EA3F92|nr:MULTISPECIES: hypothetical protein [Sphingomonadaceae]MBF7015204.1 hypothetical protein [Novosphingobium sp. HR1a]WJM30385.1 hypothetical protein QUC32_29960 [Novosphingobium resinovorum]